MNNTELLDTLKQAFEEFLTSGSRSNKKLKILHHKIATDILSLLGKEYSAKSLGIGNNQEAKLKGRYFDKKVDITFFKTVDDKKIPVAGLGVKMVMQNYAQNSNNYFENMMGETANLRSNNIPYFQFFAIPDKIPYYNNDNNITKWEGFSQHHASKYVIMSKDCVDHYMHTPTKTLLFVYHIPDIKQTPSTKAEYINYYSKNIKSTSLTTSVVDFGHFDQSVIINDYTSFITKVAHYILSL